MLDQREAVAAGYQAGFRRLSAVVRSALAKDVINLTVHDADAVNDSLFPADTNAYVFEPDFSDPVNIQWHSLITALLAEHLISNR